MFWKIFIASSSAQQGTFPANYSGDVKERRQSGKQRGVELISESYVCPEMQILLEGLGKMQTFSEVTPVISFITCGLTYTL